MGDRSSENYPSGFVAISPTCYHHAGSDLWRFREQGVGGYAYGSDTH